MRTYYVYILASHARVLYVGVTSDLRKRILQHRQKAFGGFTAKYKVTQLVYYESTDNPRSAVSRERQLKAFRRDKKLGLVESMNPDWRDLAASW